MGKYINAEELEAIVRAEIEFGRIVTEFSPEQFVKCIADTVDIVKCKDCKYLVEIDDTNDLYVCEKIDIGMDGEPIFLSPKADFCSRAERKKDE